MNFKYINCPPLWHNAINSTINFTTTACHKTTTVIGLTLTLRLIALAGRENAFSNECHANYKATSASNSGKFVSMSRVKLNRPFSVIFTFHHNKFIVSKECGS